MHTFLHIKSIIFYHPCKLPYEVQYTGVFTIQDWPRSKKPPINMNGRKFISKKSPSPNPDCMRSKYSQVSWIEGGDARCNEQLGVEGGSVAL